MRTAKFSITLRWQTVANLVTVPAFVGALYLAVSSVSAWWLLLSFVVYSLFSISTTIGYHQLFTHRSFKTTRFWEVVFSVAGVFAFQGSPVAWAHLHFVHHHTSDTEQDPHVRSLWFFIVKWYNKVNMPPAMIVKRMVADPLQKFLHTYGLLLCLGLAGVLWLIDPLLLLYGYLAPVGYFFITAACHQIFTHVGDRPRNAYWLIPFFPWGDWVHKPHHEHPNDWRKGGWCLSYYLIPFIEERV